MAAGVVLLHGFAQAGTAWAEVERALGAHARVTAPDLRGHGAAAADRPIDLAAVLADLDGVVEDGATLAGYSMGGRIALHWALSRPGRLGRLGRLVLIAASPGIADPGERARRRAADEALAERIVARGIEAFADEWGVLPLWAGQSAAVAAAARGQRLEQDPEGLAAAMRGLGTGVLPSLWGRLEEVGVPVDLIVGERDAKFRAVAVAMARELPRPGVTVVRGAGHALPLEAPGAIAAVLAASPPGSSEPV